MAWRSGTCAVLAVTGWILQSAHFPSAAMGCYWAAFLAGGWDLARETWAEFRKRTNNASDPRQWCHGAIVKRGRDIRKPDGIFFMEAT
jgi:hypothetical protein